MQAEIQGRGGHSGAKEGSRRRPGVREASFDDYEQIAAVLWRNGLSPRPRHLWTALWQGNPASERNSQRWPIGWVLESEDGRIVGCIANIPRAYVWKGAPLQAATGIDWAVDRAYRSYSLMLLQRLTSQPNVDLLVDTTVGAAAEPIFSAFQWSRVPVGFWDRAGFWITGYRGFVKSALLKKGVRAPGLLIAPIAAALACRDRLRRSEARGRSALRIERALGFDDRFDRFWEDLKRHKSGSLLALRSGAALQWHFGGHGQRTWIVTASRGGRLTAYAILARRDISEIGLTRLRVVDFQAIEDAEEAIEEILTWAIDRCRREGIHMLEDVGCALEGLGIRRAKAPHQRRLKTWTYYYRAMHHDLREALKDPSAWDPSDFDGDASL